MRRRAGGGVTLVLIHGVRPRVVRLAWPSWLLWSIPACLAVGLSLLAAASLDYFSLKRAQARLPAFERRVDAEHARLAVFARRVAEMNREVVGWQGLHVRIWSALEPSGGSALQGAGLGGADAARLPRVPDGEDAGSLARQLALLQSGVADGGRNLRGLAQFVDRRRLHLLALPGRWPVRGLINSGFGPRLSPWTGEPEFHRGLDIGAERGTSVLAPASGTVLFAGSGGEYGITVVLDHGNDLRSLYGHLQETRVRPGQRVQPGAALGAHWDDRAHLGPASALRDPGQRPSRRSAAVPLGLSPDAAALV
jgi:murein DD-endopeptidase MepM/ murein hydrolase activator NlpD